MSSEGVQVVPGTRRPDGTYRKEIRVRAGYVPQDEQRAYVPRMVQARNSAPKCPGLPPEEPAPAAKSKAEARKARREKTRAAAKQQKKETAAPNGQSSAPASPADAVAKGLDSLSLKDKAGAAPRKEA